MIFDPLLEQKPADPIPQGGQANVTSGSSPKIPRPPSTSSTHRPLQRTSLTSPVPPPVTMQNPFKDPSSTGGFQSVTPSPRRIYAGQNNAGGSRMNAGNSSEDLLKEYGLDFSKLTMAQTTAFQSATSPKIDLLAELDPLKTTANNHHQGQMPMPPPAPFNSMAPPVAPPRSKRSTASANWTTFD